MSEQADEAVRIFARFQATASALADAVGDVARDSIRPAHRLAALTASVRRCPDVALASGHVRRLMRLYRETLAHLAAELDAFEAASSANDPDAKGQAPHV